MTLPAPRWLDRCLDAVAQLGRHRGCLLSVLLLMNALALPYAGFVHDARLYSVQVLNRSQGGVFDDDLFFRHGSQDQYSAFSVALAPLATLVGIKWAFFLVYLFSNALLLYAMIRLVEALIEDRILSTLALILLAVAPTPYGGFGIFRVNENFLTPRELASSLVLLALADLLEGRAVRSLLSLLGGFLLHPIMALPGFGVYLLWQAKERLSSRWFWRVTVAATLAAMAVLAWPQLAWKLFGRMDAEWLENVRIISSYNFPLEWPLQDWIGVFVTLLLPCIAALTFKDEQPRTAFFLLAVAAVAASGLLATTIASIWGSTLLFQAQPYRALWLTKLLEVPLAGLLAARLWQSGSECARIAAVLLVGYLAVRTDLPEQFVLPLGFLFCSAYLSRGLKRMPRRPDWLSHSCAIGLVFGFASWGLLSTWIFLNYADHLREELECYYLLLLVLVTLGPVVWMLLSLAVVRAVVVWLGTGQLALTVCGSPFLLVQLTAFLVPQSDVYRAGCDKDHDDVLFLAGILESRPSSHDLPTVYCPSANIERLWLELGVRCYYGRVQIAGALFSRGTAVEGLRRARLAARFEAERLQQETKHFSDHRLQTIEEVYQVNLKEEIHPTRADLERLCLEEKLDYVVVKSRFEGLFTATNGRIYVYDCRQVRAALGGAANAAEKQ